MVPVPEMMMEYPSISDESGFRSLWDGVSLAGWQAVPRVAGRLFPGGPAVADVYAERGIAVRPDPELHAAVWLVDDGVLIGEQEYPGSGYGGYLMSEARFGDFDLALEMRPDWPADTGVMLRRRPENWTGFQVLVDHRRSGSIGGFFGNGLGSFSAVPFAIDAVVDENGRATGLCEDDPSTSVEPVTPAKVSSLSYAADTEDFLRVWRWDNWNELRVRCVGGALPTITTWVNGLRIATLDTAALESPNYDASSVGAFLGTRGHIALEVHDNDDTLGDTRWGYGARCRWRNIRIREYQ